jgi:hypothetical protein
MKRVAALRQELWALRGSKKAPFLALTGVTSKPLLFLDFNYF